MKTKEFYEEIAKQISFSTIRIDEEKKFISFHTDLCVLNEKEMTKIMSMIENCTQSNLWVDNGFSLVIHFS